MKKYWPIRCFLLQTRLIYKRKNGLDTQWEGQNFVHFISDSTFGFGFKNEKEWFIFLTQLTWVSKAICNYFQKWNQESVGETPISYY